jgi:hypothetical protein
VRKLKKPLHHDFTKANLTAGRDNLFNVLRKYKMLTLRKKHRMKTTNSNHRFCKFANNL